MNTQEKQILENFLTQLVQARVAAKDPQAEALIGDAIAKQPDAAYLLVQRALLLDQALASAKAHIASLENELQALRASGSTGFLDSANAWGNSAASRATAAPAPVATQTPSAQSPAVPRPGFLGGLGGTLGSIATTAAGVAGGALLFQGIENLFHHNGGSGFLAQQGWTPGAGETTVINNYYDREVPPADPGKAADSNFLDADWSDPSAPDDDSSFI